MRAYLGLDVGTTATKAGVFTTDGRMLALASATYPLVHPAPDRAEQDPFTIETALERAAATALAEAALPPGALAGIGLSNAMHGLMAVDDEGRPLTGLVTWADNRAIAEATALRARPEGLALYRRTGTPIHPMTPLAKLQWLAAHDPATFGRAARFVGFKSWLLHRWFGRWVIDHPLAAGMGLLALETLDWDPKALALAGIGPERLATPVPATTMLADWLPGVAERLALPAGLPVVVGAGDGMLANLGVGAIAPGEVAVTIGTSGAARAVVTTPVTDPRMRTFCYPFVPGAWVAGGATNNGGVVLRWLRDQFCLPEVEIARARGVDAYTVLAEEAARVRPGAEGLVMLPFLSGERAPYWNAEARGVLFGLSLAHGRPHVIRAAMEGVVLALDAVLAALAELEPATGDRPLRASGGFAHSTFWCQMLADASGRPVDLPATAEASVLGAAALAAHALGDLPDLAAIRAWVPTVRSFAPDPAAAPVYREIAALYDRLYDRLVDEFDALVPLRTAAP